MLRQKSADPSAAECGTFCCGQPACAAWLWHRTPSGQCWTSPNPIDATSCHHINPPSGDFTDFVGQSTHLAPSPGPPAPALTRKQGFSGFLGRQCTIAFADPVPTTLSSPPCPATLLVGAGCSWLQLVAAGWSHDGGGWRSQPTPSSPPLSHTDRFRDARPTMDVAGDVHFVASRVHPRNIECCRLQRPATSNPCRLFVLIVILSSCAAAAALASFTCDDAAAVGLKGSWFYTWSMNAAQHTQCPGAAAEFVPMYAHSVPQTSLLTKRKKRLAPGLPLPNGHWNRLLVAGIAQGPCASHCRHQEPVLIRRFSCASPSPVFKIG